MLLAFWGVSFLFVITPGADWAYAIAAGLRHKSVLPAVSGMLAGHLAATIAVAAGVAALVARAPNVMTALTIVGSTYLIWLGVGTLRHPSPPEMADATDRSTAEQLATGFGVSGLNPKVFLLFLALLPQFTVPDAVWPVPAQILTLGLVHIASCAAVYIAVGIGARTILRARPAAARAVSRFSGGAMIIIGVVLVAEHMLS
jgi:threonine/homoserine/homoserine lactone efflux protein